MKLVALLLSAICAAPTPHSDIPDMPALAVQAQSRSADALIASAESVTQAEAASLTAALGGTQYIVLRQGVSGTMHGEFAGVGSWLGSTTPSTEQGIWWQVGEQGSIVVGDETILVPRYAIVIANSSWLGSPVATTGGSCNVECVAGNYACCSYRNQRPNCRCVPNTTTNPNPPCDAGGGPGSLSCSASQTAGTHSTTAIEPRRDIVSPAEH